MGAYLKLACFAKKIDSELLKKVFIGMLITATYVLQAFALARGVSNVFSNGSRVWIAFFLFIVLIAIVTRSLLIRYNEGYTKKIAGKVKSEIRNTIIEKMMMLGPKYQFNQRSGRLQSLITDGVEAMEPFLVNYIPQTIITMVSVVSIIVYIITMDVTVGVVILSVVILAIFFPHMLMPIVRRATVGYWKEYGVLNAQYIDTMQGMNTIKVFQASKEKGKELGENAHIFARQQINNTTNSLFSSAFIVLMMSIGSFVTVGIAAWHCAMGRLSVSELLVILFLVPECMRPITDLNNFWHSSYMGFSVAEQLFAILEEPISIVDKKDGDVEKFDKVLPRIVFEKVGFSYNSKANFGIRDININIEPGQTVAVVGKSGSGKSTLVNLLLRFYDVNEGRILINDKDIREYPLEYLRSKIAVVFQDTYLFYGTIEENILIAKPEASKEEVEFAAKMANAHDFITSMPQGYKTIVGERGATLSGGERQRVAIARAILKDAPLLILDEATSSVDAASEKAIQTALEHLTKNRTTLIIAHRLSTVQNSQNIFVLDEGKLMEKGTHSELMLQDGIYTQLIKAQQKVGDEYEL